MMSTILFTLNKNTNFHLQISDEIIFKVFKEKKSVKKIIKELDEICNEIIKLNNEKISKHLKFLTDNMIKLNNTGIDQCSQHEIYSSGLYDLEDLNSLYYDEKLYPLLSFANTLEQLKKDDKFSVAINRKIIYQNYKGEL